MSHAIDADTLRQAVEGNDSAIWKSFYSDEAQMRVIDHDHPPSRPLVLEGGQAIAAMLDDICGRALKHSLDETIIFGDRLAFTETCTYPDGVKVYLSAVAELKDGKILRQINIQAWDH